MSIVRAALLICTCLCGSIASAAEIANANNISIPAGDLKVALEALVQQTGIQLLYNLKQVEGLRTAGVTAAQSPQAAVAALLKGTPLTTRTDKSGAILIAVASTPVRTSDVGQVAGSRVAQSADPEGLQEAQGEQLRFAQARGSSSGSTFRSDASAKTSGEDSKGIEEIVVTATKRAERIQDIPISISALTADDIDRRHLVGAEDYLRGIPGVNQVDSGAFGQAVVIRGIETTLVNQNFYTGATVATYFGETPTTGSFGIGGSSVDIKLVDIERVEVLRGPQGTGFGSSSLGGAVRVIPAAPKLDAVEVKLGAGHSGTSGTGGSNDMLKGAVNLPLVAGKVAIRATAYRFSDSGYYLNRAGSDPVFQARVAAFGAESFAVDADEVGGYDATGGRIAALFQAADNLRFTLSYLTQKNESEGFALATTGKYQQSVFRVAPEHVVDGKDLGFTRSDIDIASALMELDIGWADMLATYSYLEGGSRRAWPFSYLRSLPWPISIRGRSPFRQKVAEARLATKLDGPWNFIAGVHYQDNPQDNRFLDYVWHGDPDANLFPPDREVARIMETRGLTQKAAFGEASWTFLPGWTLTGGVRAYDYERDSGIDQSGALVGGGSLESNSTTASGSNFRGNLSYKLNPNALVYAGWAQGFRLGKPQPRVPAGLCDQNADGLIDGSDVTIDSTGSINSDEVESFEVGGKFAFLERRVTLDAAVFHMNWTGIPILFTAGTCTYGFTANAGDARSSGIELQAGFRLTDALRADVGGSWIDARLSKDAPGIRAFEDDRLPGSPKVNANLGLQQEFDLAGRKAFVRADAIYVGSFHGDLQESPNTRAGGYVKIDATARVSTAKLDIDLYVRNLTNEDEFTFHGNTVAEGEFYGYRLRPRTIGVQLGYSF